MRVASIILALAPLGCSVTLDFDGLAKRRADAIDCARPEADDEPSCNATGELQPGSIGDGIAPSWKTSPLTEIVGGFVPSGGNELVIAVRVQDNTNDGALIRVDLATGNRSLIAGQLHVGANLYDVGSGPYLDDVRSARELADGWAALVWDGSELGGNVYTFDPVTHTTLSSRRLGASCESAPPDVAASGVPPVLGDDAEIWLPYEASDTSDGVLRISELECEKIDLGVDAVGALAEQDGALWFIDGADGSLGRLELATKKVAMIGAPLAARAFVAGEGEVWTAALVPTLELSRVELGSGLDTPIAMNGPASLRVQRSPDFWLHPDGTRLIAELDGAITSIDPERGESAVISY